MHLLAKETSMFNEISVYETTQLYGKIGKYRYLQFSDHAIQGAMDMKKPSRILLEYPRAIIHLMEINNNSFNKVFMIGHGIGTIAGNYPEKLFTIAEMDNQVVELSKRYFGYPYDNVIIGDGRHTLSIQPANALDYVVLDAFTPKGTPIHLVTKDFFIMVMSKLTSQGMVILNLTGTIKNDRLINAVHTTLKETVSVVLAFALPGGDETDVRNIILIGSNRTVEFRQYDMAGFQEIELGEGHVIWDRVNT
ncbi:spermidine synthase [Paenibacillus sp. UNC451MF]|uniref:spermidine synthase n=1 Tax=Paenibacillus sp. UNC451MF TaxID=1449063 RepID=UPI00048DF0B7|nr:fused MFS/spermidine synthase [Paenibacillus sp. UNC451MF]